MLFHKIWANKMLANFVKCCETIYIRVFTFLTKLLLTEFMRLLAKGLKSMMLILALLYQLFQFVAPSSFHRPSPASLFPIVQQVIAIIVHFNCKSKSFSTVFTVTKCTENPDDKQNYFERIYKDGDD